MMKQYQRSRLMKMPDLTYRCARLSGQWDRHPGDDLENTGRMPVACGLGQGGNAFTLIEILIVVVILAIAALSAIPMISSAGSVQVRSAANMTAADLEYAKSLAISRGQNFSVVFDTSTESYRIIDEYGNTVPHPVKKGSDYVRDFPNEGLDRVDVVDADFDGTSQIQFDYLGSPDHGGAVTVQAGGTTATISVEPVTGYISVTN
jgi:prepilin-type N-terminal cleavage/methylation domain-containing protein